jgi:hypothetical protein
LHCHGITVPGAQRTRAFSVPIESERGSTSCFDALSSRQPVSTSLENALVLPDNSGIAEAEARATIAFADALIIYAAPIAGSAPNLSS